MDTVKEFQLLENSLQNRDPNAQMVKTQKAIIHKLIDAINEANESLLKSAGSSEEPDKILSASSILTQALAEVAKV